MSRPDLQRIEMLPSKYAGWRR